MIFVESFAGSLIFIELYSFLNKIISTGFVIFLIFFIEFESGHKFLDTFIYDTNVVMDDSGELERVHSINCNYLNDI